MIHGVNSVLSVLSKALVNCNWKPIIAAYVDKKMSQKIQRIRKCEDSAESAEAPTYVSDSCADLNAELEVMVRLNTSRFVDILKFPFRVAAFISGVQTFGVHPASVVYFLLKDGIPMMYSIVVFACALSETSTCLTCYESLSDQEMKPLIQQYTKEIPSSDGATWACDETNSETRRAISRRTRRKRRHNMSKKARTEPLFDLNNNGSVVKMGSQQHTEVVDACSICLSELNAETVKLKSCNHWFHEGCLLCLLRVVKSKEARKCPICRALIHPGSINDDLGSLGPHM